MLSICLFGCLLKWHKFSPSTLSPHRKRALGRRVVGSRTDSKRPYHGWGQWGARVMPKLFQNYRLLHCAFKQLATGNLQRATYCCYRALHFCLNSFCCLGSRTKARQSKARQVELREEKKSQGDTKQKLAKLNLWPLFFANCKCKMKCLATRQTRRDATWRAGVRGVVWCGVARKGEASNRNCLLQIISHPRPIGVCNWNFLLPTFVHKRICIFAPK